MKKITIFIIIFTIVLVIYMIYNYTRKNGWLDIFAGIFIALSLLFFGGLLLAILQGDK